MVRRRWVQAQLVNPEDGDVELAGDVAVDVLPGQQEHCPCAPPDAHGHLGLHAQVERHDDRAEPPDREVGRHQPRIVLRPGEHTVAGVDACHCQPGRDPVNHLRQSPVGPALIEEVAPDYERDRVGSARHCTVKQLVRAFRR